jgi:hypothetical protein
MIFPAQKGDRMKNVMLIVLLGLGVVGSAFAKGKSLGNCDDLGPIPKGQSCTCITDRGPRDVTCGNTASDCGTISCERQYPGHTVKAH